MCCLPRLNTNTRLLLVAVLVVCLLVACDSTQGVSTSACLRLVEVPYTRADPGLGSVQMVSQDEGWAAGSSNVG